MDEISVESEAPHAYRITVRRGRTETRHQVTVPDALRKLTSDEPRLVRESFAFLLEREPPTSILRTFSLDVIGHYFPDYEREIARRLASD